MTNRTNEQWLADLSAGELQRASAIESLRSILTTGLSRVLVNQVDATGADFDALIDDFVQDAILKILDNYADFEGRSRFTTWAHKITVNVALSELRRKRWRDKSLDGMLETDDGDYTPSFLADPAPSPDMTAEQADLLARVQHIIAAELTDKQRTAMIATAIEGKSPSEVARMMHMKTNAVYKLLHDARLRLKSRLSLYGLTPDDVLSAFS